MQTDHSPLFALCYFLLNAVVFCVYGWDKRAARRGEWRIRESTLLLLALAGGGAGAFAAQRLLRHKTRKSPFTILLPLLFILQLAWLAVALFAPDAAIALWQKIAAA